SASRESRRVSSAYSPAVVPARSPCSSQMQNVEPSRIVSTVYGRWMPAPTAADVTARLRLRGSRHERDHAHLPLASAVGDVGAPLVLLALRRLELELAHDRRGLRQLDPRLLDVDDLVLVEDLERGPERRPGPVVVRDERHVHGDGRELARRHDLRLPVDVLRRV